MEVIRRPAVAGTFYPADRDQLRSQIIDCLDAAKPPIIQGKLRGLVVPHAGYAYSGVVAAYGYKLVAQSNATHFLILGPSHYVFFHGACESGADYWETPIGKVKIKSIKEGHERVIQTISDAHAPEHCLEVQLPFLQCVLKKDFMLTPILCGKIDAEQLADELSTVLNDETIVIASSDLSHYLPYDAAIARDSIANKAIPALDLNSFEEEGDACGKLPILVLMHIARKRGWKGVFLDYRNSGDTLGDKDKVVGYGCYAFFEK